MTTKGITMTEDARRNAYQALQTALDRRDEGVPADQVRDDAYAPAEQPPRR